MFFFGQRGVAFTGTCNFFSVNAVSNVAKITVLDVVGNNNNHYNYRVTFAREAQTIECHEAMSESEVFVPFKKERGRGGR